MKYLAWIPIIGMPFFLISIFDDEGYWEIYALPNGMLHGISIFLALLATKSCIQ